MRPWQRTAARTPNATTTASSAFVSTAGMAVVLGLVAFAGCSSVDDSRRDDERAVVGVVQAFFDSMASRDVEVARRLLVPTGVFVNLRTVDSAPTLRHFSNAEYLDKLSTPSTHNLESFDGAPRVLVDGDIAVVFARYTFDVDGRRSHTGVDAFNLLRTEDGWRITGGAYTVVSAEPESAARRGSADLAAAQEVVQGSRLDRASASPAVPALPRARHGHRLERLGDELVCFGGFGDARAAERGMRDVLRLAAGDAEWRPAASMPTPRAFFGSVVWRDHVYAIGGGVDRLDGDAGTWEAWLPAGTLPDSHFGCAGHGGLAWVLGGFPLERSGCFALDLERRTVEALPPPPGFTPGDHFALLHVLDGALHVVGGLTAESSEPSPAHWVLESDGAWRALPPAPAPLFAKFAVHGVLEDALIVHHLMGTLRYDAVGGWAALAPPAPEQHFAMPAAVTIGGALWALGGLPLEDGRPAHLSLAAVDLRWVDHRAP